MPYRPSSKEDLLDAIRRADVVFGADFHAYAQAQRTHLRLLRALDRDRKVIVAFECLPHSRQKTIDDYLKGKIDPVTFRRKIQWDRNWGFPWRNYEPLFELARERKWRILGVGAAKERKMSLRQREILATRVLTDARKQTPESLFYVVFGELHLCESNLPRTLSERDDARQLKIHLNPDSIYFDLASKNLEHEIDVVLLRSGDFAVMASPPWIQWQSYLLFLETEFAGVREKFGDADFTDPLADLIKTGNVEIGLQTKIDGFELSTIRDRKSLEVVLRRMSPEDRRIAHEKMRKERSFFIPRKGSGGAAYLGGTSLNHLALLAGHIIYAKNRGLVRPLWNGRRDFESAIWAETVAVFFSKLINHKRQTESFVDLQNRYDALPGTSDQKDALKIALLYSFNEVLIARGREPRPIRIRPSRKSSWAEAARIVGEMRGEKLYIAYRSRRLKKKDVIELVKQDPLSSETAEFFRELIRNLAANLRVERNRSERL